MLEIKLRNIAADKIITATTQFETLKSYVNEISLFINNIV